MRRFFYVILVAFILSPAPRAAELTVIGAWTLNRQLTQMPLERPPAARLPRTGQVAPDFEERAHRFPSW